MENYEIKNIAWAILVAGLNENSKDTTNLIDQMYANGESLELKYEKYLTIFQKVNTLAPFIDLAKIMATDLYFDECRTALIVAKLFRENHLSQSEAFNFLKKLDINHFDSVVSLRDLKLFISNFLDDYEFGFLEISEDPQFREELLSFYNATWKK